MSAAYLLGKAGLNVVLFERGDFPGAKNVMGGILYRGPVEQVFPGFWKEAPLERPIIEQQVWILSKDGALKMGHRNQAFAAEPYNCFSVLRARFDQWLAEQVRAAGVLIIPETVVEDLLWEDGKVVGVRAGRDEGEVACDVVVAADGVNSLLAEKAGLHSEWKADEVAVAVKEVIALPPEQVEARFQLQGNQGVTIEAFGEATAGMVGTAFIYTNKESLSVGVGALLSDVRERGITPNDMLEQFKSHPAIAPLLKGGEVREYMAHLIPEGGYKSLPKLYTHGMVVVGDAAMLVNSMHREGSNLAMLSGRYAAEAILRAKEWNDFSAAALSRYEQLLTDSLVLKDLHKYRNATRFFEHNRHFFTLYPELANRAAQEMMTVDSEAKRDKQRKILRMAFEARPKWRLALDMWRAFRAMW